MKVLVPLQLALVSVMLLAAAGPIRAESDEYAAPVYGVSTADSSDQKIESLEADMASLRQELGSSVGCDTCGDCQGCCAVRSCGWTFQAEALLLAYHRADGMRVGSGNNEQVNSSFNLAPRLTLGYAGPEGTGIRVRWFDYNHNEESVNSRSTEFISVDTFNIDIELYDEICLNPNWTVELSGGYRYNNFDEFMADDGELRRSWSNSQGGIIGIEGRRHFCWGTLYGGLRASLLMGDHTLLNESEPSSALRLGDVVQGIWEIGIGYEKTWESCYGAFYVRVGGEWQKWENFSSAFDYTEDEDSWDGESDVGFGGFTFAMGLIR